MHLRCPRLGFLLLLAGWGGSCQTPIPPPAPGPPLVAPDGLVIESRTYAGTILGGLGTAEAESEVALAWDVDVALVERMPLQGTEALAPHW
ncbi:MAG TPA: hypothetical protein P5218_09860, partial [Planctomycetota bacterium]|nr:hypothetical protein [Planctomycetota bacterium]